MTDQSKENEMSENLEPTYWDRLCAWLAEDREDRMIKVQVGADDPVWADDDSDTVIEQPFTFSVEAHETGLWGDDDTDEASLIDAGIGGSCTVYTHVGHGRTLDIAAAVCLAMLAEHTKLAQR